jgi:hypothetical protein
VFTTTVILSYKRIRLETSVTRVHAILESYGLVKLLTKYICRLF